MSTAGPTRLVLASASPQRREILARAGIAFDVRPADVEERTAGDPAAVAEGNARLKALAVPSPLTLGADTLVTVDGDILGKPAGRAAARASLRRLAGRTHAVMGGLALAQDGVIVASFVEVTHVRFRALDDGLLDWYVATGEWQGRAGGYAIQGAGAAVVAAIDGDYSNVVGLPLARLVELRPDLLPLA